MVNYPHLLFLTLTLPLCPLLAFALSLWLPQKAWRISATLAILGQLLATIAAAALFWIFLSPSPLFTSPPHTSETSRYYWNFVWLQLESIQFPIAFLLDPITAAMGLMVATVSLLVFIFSLGYMADDPNSGKFFTYLSLFTAAMQGVVISNSLLLTFISWELVGLCSYLLIGFWHQKPAAAAAAKKAFLVTRFADIGFFLGILWMQAATGTLLLYNNGHGILETDMLNGLSSTLAFGTITLSNAIALLIFLGAAGKSGQFPLHIWLPDAMEGPTPVSALIHAATMVAAGVYLVIRLFPLFNAAQISPTDSTLPLSVVTWVGATTALFAALLAIGQYDIKRILAYSTISQLGFMMLAVGVGAPIAGLLHLLAHGIFKALLFLGAGSVIHGCNGEQDIRLMGGLRKSMPLTFLLYLIGTLSLAGFPILFCGFWTKESIFHAAHSWPLSQVPYLLASFAAFLTAFYMIRQNATAFSGTSRSLHHPHESPPVMIIPMAFLAALSLILNLFLTPAWPWLEFYLERKISSLHFNPSAFANPEFLSTAILSSCLTLGGIISALLIYLRARGKEPLSSFLGPIYSALENRLWVDEFFRLVLVKSAQALSCLFAAADSFIFQGSVVAIAKLATIFAKIVDFIDQFFVNLWFDVICGGMKDWGTSLARISGGRASSQLRFLAAGLAALLAWLLFVLVVQA